MHRLDGHINDLEPRIKDIYDSIPEQSQTSLQVSLSAYGWILLDSWVAWRTLRYLLKDTYIEDSVNEKWFQTPSSYTSTQIKVAWRFDDLIEEYIRNKTGMGLKELFDKTIQGKRNASAHFTKNAVINGSDFVDIKLYFAVLSKVFLFYETKAFFTSVTEKLSLHGYERFKLYFDEIDEEFDFTDISGKINEYEKCKSFSVIGEKDDGSIINIYVEEEGCFAGCNIKPEKRLMKSVINSTHSRYDFWKNKGFYQDVDLFVNTVYECIKDLPERNLSETISV